MGQLYSTYRTKTAFVAVVILSLLFWAAFARLARNPLVVDDEVLFFVTGLSIGRLPEAQAMHAAIHPSKALLYEWVIHFLSLTPAPIVAAIKTFNLACIVGAAVLLCLYSRGARLAAPRPSLLVYALFAPICSYVCYTTPECFYAFVFAVSFCLMLTEWKNDFVKWVSVAVVLAVLSLIKPHGMMCFLVFEIVTLLSPVILCVSWGRALLLAAAAAAAYAVVLGLGGKILYPVQTAQSVDLLGPVYRAELVSIFAHGLWAMIKLVLAYFCGVLTLLGPAIVVLVACLKPKDADGAEIGRLRFAALLVLLLTAMLAGVAAMTFVTEAVRMHLRYVAFLFLPILVTASALMTLRGEPSRTVRTVAGAVWLVGVVGMALWLSYYRPLPDDSPDLFFLYKGEFGPFGLGRWTYLFLIAPPVIGSAALVWSKVKLLHVQLAVLALFSVVAIANTAQWEKVFSLQSAGFRQLGDLASTRCGKGKDDVIAVGTPDAFVPLYNAIYQLHRPAPFLVDSPSDAEDVIARSVPGQCILTMVRSDERNFATLDARDGVYLYQRLDRSLFKKDANGAFVQFNNGVKSPLLTSGWSNIEPAGVWSVGHSARVTVPSQMLAEDAPNKIGLRLLGFTPPSIPTQKVTVSVGGRVLARWSVGSGWMLYEVEVPRGAVAPGHDLVLDFDLPQAAQPSATLPGSTDPRLLAIAIQRLQVER